MTQPKPFSERSANKSKPVQRIKAIDRKRFTQEEVEREIARRRNFKTYYQSRQETKTMMNKQPKRVRYNKLFENEQQIAEYMSANPTHMRMNYGSGMSFGSNKRYSHISVTFEYIEAAQQHRPLDLFARLSGLFCIKKDVQQIATRPECLPVIFS